MQRRQSQALLALGPHHLAAKPLAAAGLAAAFDDHARHPEITDNCDEDLVHVQTSRDTPPNAPMLTLLCDHDTALQLKAIQTPEATRHNANACNDKLCMRTGNLI